LVIAAAFTSFYSWRLMFLTFWGEPRGDRHAHEHAHESPRIMLIPLGVLSLGAIFAGMIWYGPFFGDHEKLSAFFGIPAHAEAAAHGETATGEAGHGAAEAGKAEAIGWHPGQGAIYMHPDNHVLEEAHHAPKWAKVSPFIAMLLGLFTAWMFYIRRPEWPARLAEIHRPLYLFLLNKWYFDEIYDFVFVRLARWLGNVLWRRGDGGVIDGTINTVAMRVVPFFTGLAVRAQSGYLFHYALAIVIGITALVTWLMIAGGTH
ncbi:MAG: NADH-quinone oxidoreductase subunit L, partial [Alphaproteobacteria bacterium]